MKDSKVFQNSQSPESLRIKEFLDFEFSQSRDFARFGRGLEEDSEHLGSLSTVGGTRLECWRSV